MLKKCLGALLATDPERSTQHKCLPLWDKHSVLARLDSPDCLFSGTPSHRTPFCFFGFFFPPNRCLEKVEEYF